MKFTKCTFSSTLNSMAKASQTGVLSFDFKKSFSEVIFSWLSGRNLPIFSFFYFSMVCTSSAIRLAIRVIAIYFVEISLEEKVHTELTVLAISLPVTPLLRCWKSWVGVECILQKMEKYE